MTALRTSGEVSSKEGMRLEFPPLLRKLSSASLVLIDRSEDLFTPLANSGTHPLAHRIFNTLKCFQYSETVEDWNCGKEYNYDLSVTNSTAALTARTISATARRITSRKKLPMLLPMSGLAQLSIPISPSLRYSFEKDLFFQRVSGREDLRIIAEREGYSLEDHENNRTLLELLSGNEDDGRDFLVRNLKVRIAIENGKLPPPKKRGLGAEILALTQALLDAPGEAASAKEQQLTGKISTGALSARTSIHSYGVLSLAAAVVESMQRSSSKQFPSICKWQCGYETRAAREADMQNRIQTRRCDFDVCLSLLNSQLSSRLIAKPREVGDSPRKGAEKEKAGSSDADVVDLVHTLTQIIR